MPYFEYKEKKIFYQTRESNTNSTIIFIHGSGGNSNIWKYQLNDSILNHNLIAVDLPSHDQSEIFPELSIELFVDVIKFLLNQLNLKKVIFAGHSLGGAIVQSYYFKYPEDIIALILIGTGSRLRVSPAILNLLKSNFQEFLEGLPIGSFYHRSSKQLIDEHLSEISKTDPKVIYSDFKMCDNFDVMDKLNSIDVPCLIICGNEDKLTPPKYSKFFKDNLKKSKLSIIKNAGHMVMLEKPNELNHAICEFLKNNLQL